MNKEKFIDILKAEAWSRSDLYDLDKLIREYPWFALPRFIKLKAAYKSEEVLDPGELSKTVVFSSDRKFLYHWMRGEIEVQLTTPFLSSTEIEFLDDQKDGTVQDFDAEAFELLESDLDETEVKAIPEKDEAEMEEPEIDEIDELPVIDHLDDEMEDIDPDEAEEKAVLTDEVKHIEPETEVEDFRGADKRNATGSGSNKSLKLIEQFLQADPGVIKADKQASLQGDVSEGSVKEDDSFITDTLARIYVKQGLHAKAIYAYERLSLKYPEKSAYFAAQIEKIKNILNV